MNDKIEIEALEKLWAEQKKITDSIREYHHSQKKWGLYPSEKQFSNSTEKLCELRDELIELEEYKSKFLINCSLNSLDLMSQTHEVSKNPFDEGNRRRILHS